MSSQTSTSELKFEIDWEGLRTGERLITSTLQDIENTLGKVNLIPNSDEPKYSSGHFPQYGFIIFTEGQRIVKVVSNRNNKVDLWGVKADTDMRQAIKQVYQSLEDNVGVYKATWYRWSDGKVAVYINSWKTELVVLASFYDKPPYPLSQFSIGHKDLSAENYLENFISSGNFTPSFLESLGTTSTTPPTSHNIVNRTTANHSTESKKKWWQFWK